MAENRSTHLKIDWGQLSHSPEEGERLWRWLFLSGFIHIALIISLFVIPPISAGRRTSYPVYTVDLVGGERIGGTSVGSVVAPGADTQREPKKTKVESLPPPKKAKEEKAKPAERTPLMEEKVALKKTKKEAKKEAQEEQRTLDHIRQSLLQDAVRRTKDRPEGEQKGKKEGMSLGPGKGPGAISFGEKGLGGEGILKSVEFVRYLDQMRSAIRERWIWAGKRTDLEVTVRFGIQEDGEITGLKIVKRSGDSSYDDSVLRALRNASPLPQPPEDYRNDFMDVELIFRPKDLGR